MDAFFAAAELTRHPEWRGRPLIIGARPGERGVVSTCSYEARAFGVRSAMSSAMAYRLCPQGIFIPGDLPFYHQLSAQVFAIFADFSPIVEAVSVDEAFIDITGVEHRYGGAKALAGRLQGRIRDELKLSCSIGIAKNRLLAKIGSELRKPGGISVLPVDDAAVAAFLAPRPIGILWGVGEKTRALLAPYGITTCGDIQRIAVCELAALIGANAAAALRELAFGRSSDEVSAEPAAEKSVSAETTFPQDVSSREQVLASLLELVRETGTRFRSERRWAETVRIKLRLSDFSTQTRQLSLPQPTRDEPALVAAAKALFARLWPVGMTREVRLVGFALANFCATDSPEGPRLIADETDLRRQKAERLSDALDSLRRRGYRLGLPSDGGI